MAKTTILLRRDVVRKLSKDKAFISLMCLMRAANALRFALDGVFAYTDEDSPRSTRAKFTGGLFFVGTTAESLRTLKGHRRHIEALEGFDRMRRILDSALFLKMNDDQGFLTRLRSKVSFHFTSDHMTERLNRHWPDPAVLLTVDPEKPSDVHYAMPDFAVGHGTPEHLNPTIADIEEFTKLFPELQWSTPPEPTGAKELDDFLLGIDAARSMAFAFVAGVDAMVFAQAATWDVFAGRETDEGIVDRTASKI